MPSCLPACLLSAAAMLLSCAPADAQEAAPATPLDCGSGPVSRTYAAVAWLVFACSDEKSLVVVSAPGNEGNPFFFKLFIKDGVRQVVGEGVGSPKVTSAAYQELVKLTEADIATLISAAKDVPKSAAK